VVNLALFVDMTCAHDTLAVFAFPLQSRGIRLGTLDFYRRRQDSSARQNWATRVCRRIWRQSGADRTGAGDDLLSGTATMAMRSWASSLCGTVSVMIVTGSEMVEVAA
jgi:hypothetical protein